jgi:hypothetical protein
LYFNETKININSGNINKRYVTITVRLVT